MNALLVHPACVVSVTLTALRTEPTRRDPNAKDSFLINISGRLLMVNQNTNNNQVWIVILCFVLLVQTCPFTRLTHSVREFYTNSGRFGNAKYLCHR